jgi:hypothetical protein
MTSTNLFLETCPPQQIITKIKKGEWSDIINGLCYVKDNTIILDNTYFKYFATKETYDIILSHITIKIDNILSIYDGFIVCINMKNLNVSDVDKHISFIQSISLIFKKKYSNKLIKCWVHNAPFVFSQILNIVSFFIDKETQQKIELVQTK